MIKKIAALIVLLLGLNICYSQNKRTIKIKEIYNVQYSGFIEKLELYIPIPKDYDKLQDVKRIKYSQKPAYTFGDSDHQYAVFEFSPFKLKDKPTIEIKIEMELFDYDLLKAEKQPLKSRLKEKKLKKFLKTKGLYNLPESIITANLFPDSVPALSKANQIHDFVVYHLNYKTFFGEDKGANHAYQTKEGDCTEYADLMIALCRYNNLPAKRVHGFTVKEDTSFLSKVFSKSGHAWVEVYFDEYGWIPFDPTHSDGDNVTNFYNLENKYIYLNRSNLPENAYSKYWGLGQAKIKVRRQFMFN